LIFFSQRLFSNVSSASSLSTPRLNTVVPKGFEKYFPGGGGKGPQPKDPGISFFNTREFYVSCCFYLAGSQRPPAPRKEPAPGETPPEGGQPKPPTPGPSPGGRGTPPPPSSGGRSSGSWRGLEFKFTPGENNSFFNNRTALALLIGGGLAAYFTYNNTLYREITWKDFVSTYLLKGYVSSIAFNRNKMRLCFFR
jgi:hypothetical protein